MKKRKNEMMTRILKNEIRNIEQKQEIEKRQKEERKVKVRVGEKLEQIVQLVKSLAQKARVFFGRLQCLFPQPCSLFFSHSPLQLASFTLLTGQLEGQGEKILRRSGKHKRKFAIHYVDGHDSNIQSASSSLFYLCWPVFSMPPSPSPSLSTLN